jgi:trans-aconitate methyltransferase
MAVPQEVNTRFFDRMKKQGLQFKNVVDIGCYIGAWTKRVKESYPDANYYLIDAK